MLQCCRLFIIFGGLAYIAFALWPIWASCLHRSVKAENDLFNDGTEIHNWPNILLAAFATVVQVLHGLHTVVVMAFFIDHIEVTVHWSMVPLVNDLRKSMHSNRFPKPIELLDKIRGHEVDSKPPLLNSWLSANFVLVSVMIVIMSLFPFDDDVGGTEIPNVNVPLFGTQPVMYFVPVLHATANVLLALFLACWETQWEDKLLPLAHEALFHAMKHRRHLRRPQLMRCPSAARLTDDEIGQEGEMALDAAAAVRPAARKDDKGGGSSARSRQNVSKTLQGQAAARHKIPSTHDSIELVTAEMEEWGLVVQYLSTTTSVRGYKLLGTRISWGTCGRLIYGVGALAVLLVRTVSVTGSHLDNGE